MKAEELMVGDKIIAKRIECVGDGGQFQEWDEFGEIIRILEDTVYVIHASPATEFKKGRRKKNEFGVG